MSHKFEPPFVIQGSESPAFRGVESVDHKFRCCKCSHILIENFDYECYICVGIQCFRCKTVSMTSDLPIGEVFAASTISLGTDGKYLLGSTVDLPTGVILTTSYAIEREISSTAPSENGIPLEFTVKGLDEVIALYERLTGVDFSKQESILSRKSDEGIKTYPFPWALRHLRRCVDHDYIDLTDPKTCTAMLWAEEFCHLAGIWASHPRFPAIAVQFGMPGQFLHTSTMLLTAAYLYKAGNRIGITTDEKANAPNPDLYVRGIGGKKLYLEIKTPEALRWPVENISFDQLNKAVKRCIKKSSGQINRNHPGILVIGSSLVARKFPEFLGHAMKRGLAAEGRSHKGLAAVVGVSPLEISISRSEPQSLQYGAAYRFEVELNAHFEGRNPVRSN